MTWRRALLFAGLGVWLAGVAMTFFFLWRYKMTPGPLAEAPATWPVASSIARDPQLPNIVMFAHPQCPCTRASMTELARLSDELNGRAKIHVVLVRPDGVEPGFEDGAVATRAAQIPGVDVVVDDGGKEADRFGAIVSGSTVVYGRDGKLLFRGGLTIARGHEGRGPAHDRILSLLSNKPADRADAPTFGCDLADHETLTAARVP